MTANGEEAYEQIIREGLGRTGAPSTVLILGGGMAGLTAADVLVRAGHDVTIVEAQTRVGGRVQTFREPFSEGLFAEAGAMRIPKTHRLTRAYIERFGLSTVPFTMNNPRGYVRLMGSQKRAEDYHLDDPVMARWEAALAPLLERIERDGEAGWEAVEAANDHYSLREFLEVSGFSENDIEVLSLLTGMEPLLNTAFMEVVREEQGKWFTDVDTIEGGMDRLPKAFLPSLKGRIRFGARVCRIEEKASGVEVTCESAAGTTRYAAARVIVTLPFGVLRHIEIVPGLSREKERAIRQLNYDASTKILLQCRRRFWEEDDGIIGGATVTDLPIRSMYYPDQGRETGRGVILASYTWAQDAERWASLEPHRRLEEAIENVALIHPQILQEFEAGAVKVWQEDPFACGAFALFEAGQQTLLYADIIRAEGRLHFAGEHASLAHAWIQGAIESGLRAAVEVHEAAGQGRATS